MDTTQLLKGVLDLAILAVLRDGDGYGYDVLRRLRASGMSPVGHTSVYGSLRRLLAAGHLAAYEGASAQGPQRRYYTVCDQGLAELDRGGRVWREFGSAMDRLLR